MNYNEAMQYIHGRLRFGSKLELTRIIELLRRLGNPQKKTKFVHVAGTNGKGSTVTMLAEILAHAGYRTGKYTSPYVFEFRERIVINGNMIEKDALCKFTERISLVCEQMENDGFDEVTEFEFITVLAFCYFAEQKCDIAVLEVGLGGRFDATNVIDAPLVSVITSLSLDHTAILGDTIEQIAFEKCGIIKTPSPTVLYPIQEQGALKTVSEIASQRSCRLIIPDIDNLEILKCDLTGNHFVYGGKEYYQSLLGEYQIYNAITVLEVIEILRQGGFIIPQEAVKLGLQHCRMPARFDKVSDKPLIIMDAGHNPQGIDVLTDLMDRVKGCRFRIVFAVMQDKEYDYAIKALSKRVDRFYAVPLKELPRALDAKTIAKIASENCENTVVASDVNSAIDMALDEIGEDCLLICGSFYIMEQARNALKNKEIL